MDAVELLTQQHREVESLAERFLNLGTEAVDEKRDIARTVVEQLSIHATIEEMAFYPAVREAMPDLDATLDEHLRDHQKVKDLAQQLLGMDPRAPRFATTIIQLVGEVKEHVTEEEGELFPRVRQSFEPVELEELGQAMQDLQDHAARRPHPWAPDTPPLNRLAVPIASRLDRLRSAVRDRIGKKTV